MCGLNSSAYNQLQIVGGWVARREGEGYFTGLDFEGWPAPQKKANMFRLGLHGLCGI